MFMHKIIATGSLLATLGLVGCSASEAPVQEDPTTSVTNTKTSTATTEQTTETAAAKSSSEQVEMTTVEPVALGRPDISEMTWVDGLGLLGIYFDGGHRYYLCDFRDEPLSIVDETGCASPYNSLYSAQMALTQTLEVEEINPMIEDMEREMDAYMAENWPEYVEPTTSTYVEPTTPTYVEPYVVECLEGTPGPAMWSDGSMAYSEECYQQGISEPGYVDEGWLHSPNNPANAEYYEDPSPKYVEQQ